MYFFAVKAFTRLLRNFFEICRRGGCSILRLVDSLLFLVCQNATKKWKMSK